MKKNKKLIVIIGSNGVGKSTSAKSFLEQNPQGAFVDSDWCRVINPFAFTKETKKTVTDNIFCLLHNYIRCTELDYVIFTYGFHGERKAIFDEVLRRLKQENVKFQLCIVILKCSLSENVRRMRLDGREESRIQRGIDSTFGFYDEYDYPAIDTTELEVGQVAERIAGLAGMDID